MFKKKGGGGSLLQITALGRGKVVLSRPNFHLAAGGFHQRFVKMSPAGPISPITMKILIFTIITHYDFKGEMQPLSEEHFLLL